MSSTKAASRPTMTACTKRQRLKESGYDSDERGRMWLDLLVYDTVKMAPLWISAVEGSWKMPFLRGRELR